MSTCSLYSYFYWSQSNSGLFRALLSDVQVNTPTCLESSGISEATQIISDPLLQAFTVESSLFYIGSSDCFLNLAFPSNTALFSRILKYRKDHPHCWNSWADTGIILRSGVGCSKWQQSGGSVEHQCHSPVPRVAVWIWECHCHSICSWNSTDTASISLCGTALAR